MDVLSFPKCSFSMLRLQEVRAWCEEHIEPRRYYLHSSIGAKNWRIVIRQNNVFEIHAPERELMVLALKFT